MKKKTNYNNLLFIISLTCIWIIVGISLLKNNNEINEVENRTAYKLEKFSINKYENKTYQENIEQAIKDQLPLYNYFELLYPKITNNINYSLTKNIKNKYIQLKKGLCIYNNYLVYKDPINKKEQETYNYTIKKINYIKNHTSSNVYVYYINTDNNYEFSHNKPTFEDIYVKERLENDIKFSTFKLNGFDDYKKYFYKYDHHWNNKGSYKGYKEIAQMMNYTNILDIKNTVCYKRKFKGSKSTDLAIKRKDKICVDDFNYPEFKIIINKEEINKYGMTTDEVNSLNELSYASIYGSDYAEIIIQNKKESNNKNLLIYGNSYTNSINKLLASEYKNTYIIDGRFFRDFNMINYVKEKEIDDILIITNRILFFDDNMWGDF